MYTFDVCVCVCALGAYVSVCLCDSCVVSLRMYLVSMCVWCMFGVSGVSVCVYRRNTQGDKETEMTEKEKEWMVESQRSFPFFQSWSLPWNQGAFEFIGKEKQTIHSQCLHLNKCSENKASSKTPIRCSLHSSTEAAWSQVLFSGLSF